MGAATGLAGHPRYVTWEVEGSCRGLIYGTIPNFVAGTSKTDERSGSGYPLPGPRFIAGIGNHSSTTAGFSVSTDRNATYLWAQNLDDGSTWEPPEGTHKVSNVTGL